MPQIFQVLKCYKCEIFQVHLTKKSPKWECKMCGEKQSIKRHYGIGTAQDCRGHVQRLNTMQGGKSDCSSVMDMDSTDNDYSQSSNELKENYTVSRNKRVSKWSAFIEDNEDDPSISTKPEYNEDTQLVSELPKNHKITYNETVKSDDITKKKYSNQKACSLKAITKKHCNEHLTKQSKWLAYTLDNENIPEPKNESISCNKNDIISQITNLKYSKPNKEEFGIDLKQNNKKRLSNTKVKNVTDNENIANVISYAKGPHENHANDDVIILEKNNTDIITSRGSEWSQFHETNDIPRDKSESKGQKDNKLVFSLCDDRDLDSILDF